MNAILLAIALLGGVGKAQEGDIVFVSHGDTLVALKTNSDITHVATVFKRDGKLYIYEATRPRVQTITWQAFVKRYERRKKAEFWIARPVKQYTEKQLKEMQRYADSQLGREYSIMGYVKGKPVKGIDCTEYTARQLMQADKMKIDRPETLAPIDLWKIMASEDTFEKLQ